MTQPDESQANIADEETSPNFISSKPPPRSPLWFTMLSRACQGLDTTRKIIATAREERLRAELQAMLKEKLKSWMRKHLPR